MCAGHATHAQPGLIACPAVALLPWAHAMEIADETEVEPGAERQAGRRRADAVRPEPALQILERGALVSQVGPCASRIAKRPSHVAPQHVGLGVIGERTDSLVELRQSVRQVAIQQRGARQGNARQR